MATTVTFKDMSAGTTEGLEELVSSVGTPVVSTTVGRTHGTSYALSEGDEIVLPSPPTGKGGIHIAIRFTDAPSSTVEICKLGAGAAFKGTIDLNTSRQFVFKDDPTSAATIGTSAALAVDTFGSISWSLEDSATAVTKAFLNGVQVFDTTADHSENWGTGVTIKNPASSGITTLYVTDYAVWDLVGTPSEVTIHDAEVLGFSTTHAATDTDIGDAPTGNWSNVAEFPKDDGNLCVFDSVGSAKFMDQTTGDGPQGSADIDGEQHIVAAKFYHRMASGNGQGRDHISVLGHDGNTTTTTAASVTLQEDARSLSGTPADFFTLTTDPLFMPGVNQHAAIGVGKDATGGQDTELYEAMCMVLHVPRPTPTTPTNLSDLNFGTQNSYHGPYQTV